MGLGPRLCSVMGHMHPPVALAISDSGKYAEAPHDLWGSFTRSGAASPTFKTSPTPSTPAQTSPFSNATEPFAAADAPRETQLLSKASITDSGDCKETSRKPRCKFFRESAGLVSLCEQAASGLNGSVAIKKFSQPVTHVMEFEVS